ncbi:hypothetical protein ACH5RR_012052 [Cinchona calisaya]|uniref:Uncharacterized protein n=1 Tax=Cinchona calisaya TaxID=153742 RepID=A0ABD3A951_9GENT
MKPLGIRSTVLMKMVEKHARDIAAIKSKERESKVAWDEAVRNSLYSAYEDVSVHWGLGLESLVAACDGGRGSSSVVAEFHECCYPGDHIGHVHASTWGIMLFKLKSCDF